MQEVNEMQWEFKLSLKRLDNARTVKSREILLQQTIDLCTDLKSKLRVWNSRSATRLTQNELLALTLGQMDCMKHNIINTSKARNQLHAVRGELDAKEQELNRKHHQEIVSLKAIISNQDLREKEIRQKLVAVRKNINHSDLEILSNVSESGDYPFLRQEFSRILDEKQDLLQQIRKRDDKILKLNQNLKQKTDEPTRSPSLEVHHSMQQAMQEKLQPTNPFVQVNESTEHHIVESERVKRYEMLEFNVMVSSHRINELEIIQRQMSNDLKLKKEESLEFLKIIKRKEIHNDGARDKIHTMQKMIDHLQEKLQDKEAAMNDTKQKIHTMKQVLDQKMREINHLKVEKQRISEKYKATNQDAHGYQGKIVALEDVVQDLRTKLQEKHQESAQLIMNIHKMSRETEMHVQALKAKIAMRDARIESMRIEHRKDKKHRVAGTATNESNHSSISEDEILDLKQKLEASRKMVHELRKKVFDETMVIEADKVRMHRLGDLVLDCEAERDYAEEIRRKLAESKSKQQKDLDLYYQKNKKKNKMIETLKMDNNALRLNLQRLQKTKVLNYIFGTELNAEKGKWDVKSVLGIFAVLLLTAVWIHNPDYVNRKMFGQRDTDTSNHVECAFESEHLQVMEEQMMERLDHLNAVHTQLERDLFLQKQHSTKILDELLDESKGSETEYVSTLQMELF